MSIESGRYALDNISVTETGFVVTNGYKLFCCCVNHHLQPGLLHLTTEGFGLANNDAGNFPKWQDVTLKDDEVKEIYKANDLIATIPENFIYHLNRTGLNFRIGWTLDVLNRLEKLNATDLVLYVHNKNATEKQFMIRGRIQDSNFLYVQMPIQPPREQ